MQMERRRPPLDGDGERTWAPYLVLTEFSASFLPPPSLHSGRKRGVERIALRQFVFSEPFGWGGAIELARRAFQGGKCGAEILPRKMPSSRERSRSWAILDSRQRTSLPSRSLADSPLSPSLLATTPYGNGADSPSQGGLDRQWQYRWGG